MNLLYYGDNLDVLQRHVRDESVDLVYLDPPFKSNQDYNVLFAEHGKQAAAQIKAFEDTWAWDESAARSYELVVEAGGRVSDVMQAFRTFLGESDMLAYLAMMGPRLVELRRALKPTGSIYLHCDPTASHYLKMLMDAIFDPRFFKNEIIWKRHNARSTDQRWPRIHDVLLFYSRGEAPYFQATQVKGDKAKLPHTLITGPDGKKYQTADLTGAGITKDGESGRPWRDYDPSEFGRHWANTQAVMEAWDHDGLIHWPKGGSAGGFPRRRDALPFVEEERLVTVGDVWVDIDRINQSAKERLGYPTQKPEALLERIITASSKEGQVVLDPFCGCGTTIAAAQKLGREWIGIDVTHLAIGLIKHRLRDSYGPSIEKAYEVHGEPTTEDGARKLAEDDKFEFQAWALGLVGARRDDQKKGADKGIDGRLFFHDEGQGGKTKGIIFSVKGGNLKATDMRDLRGVIEREKAAIGVLVSLNDPTTPMRKEAASAGFYTSPWDQKKYPRLQIRTIRELLNGKDLEYPARAQTNVTHKKAPKSDGGGKQLGLLSGAADDEDSD